MLESLGQRSSFTRIKNARGFDLGLLFCKTVWGSIPLKVISFILQKGEVVCKGLENLYQLVLNVSLSNVTETNVVKRQVKLQTFTFQLALERLGYTVDGLVSV